TDRDRTDDGIAAPQQPSSLARRRGLGFAAAPALRCPARGGVGRWGGGAGIGGRGRGGVGWLGGGERVGIAEGVGWGSVASAAGSPARTRRVRCSNEVSRCVRTAVKPSGSRAQKSARISPGLVAGGRERRVLSIQVPRASPMASAAA